MIKWLLQKLRTPKSRSQAERMLTLQSAPVYYLPITKSGSTYLKNLFYYLDHADEHVAGLDIHSNPQDLKRAKASDEESINQSPHSFTVLRDPVDRFISLYFDKIYSEGPRSFPDTRRMLIEKVGLDLSPELDLAGHQKNCDLFIDWLQLNLAHETDEPVNPHWRRQSSRIQRADSLELKHLTLEGLNWQLPIYLADVVPNIGAAMSAVKSVNRTDKPFARDALVDDALTAKIENVYAYDKALHQQAQKDWQPWFQHTDEIQDGDTLKCYTATGFPINYIVTQKVGCTYLRNMLYILEHGAAYHSPLKVHTKGVSSKSILGKKELAVEVSFFVVREPAARFFSLYFDKVYGDGEQSFPWITRRLVNHRGFLSGKDLSIEEHRHNVDAFLGYLERRFRIEPLLKQNPHWGQQVVVARKAIQFGLKPLLLENLDEQLLQIADGRIEGLEQAMKSVPHRNHSKRPFRNSEILTPEFSARISALYADDEALYQRVKTGWQLHGQPPKL